MEHEELLSDLVGRVVDDAKAVAEAELLVAKERAKAEVGARARKFGVVTTLFVFALSLASAALVALLVGLVLTMSPRIGPGPATLIVTAGALMLAVILTLIGRAEYRRVRR